MCTLTSLRSIFTGKRCYAAAESREKAARILNFKSQKNTVIVLAYPKSGSHLVISILDELGKFDYNAWCLNVRLDAKNWELPSLVVFLAVNFQ